MIINLSALLTVIMLLCLPNNRELKHKQCKMIVLGFGCFGVDGDSHLFEWQKTRCNLSSALMGPRADGLCWSHVQIRIYHVTDESAASNSGLKSEKG